jgi:hypothetical protein
MTSASTNKYRSRAIANSVIAFSISYERGNMLARGMGLEHLRELGASRTAGRLGRPFRNGLRPNHSCGGHHWSRLDSTCVDISPMANLGCTHTGHEGKHTFLISRVRYIVAET